METTPIKLHEDICGDSVTIDFNNLLATAEIAAELSGQAVTAQANKITYNRREKNFSALQINLEMLERALYQHKKSINVLEKLTALSNRIYNLNCELITLVSTYEEKI